ncbi:hypothetical protein VNI00_014247 [Paramarasmius palmivorus]|uniref:Bacteriophage T5 Orf172 DNA-binding domain-containing protein n=1 Tax=Paramarasmius palmivorus TaxID=297713 RepID=A0AAW0B9P0_9AGAR
MARSRALRHKMKMKPSKADKRGSIYVLERKEGTGRLWKVGRSNCVPRRVKEWNRLCKGHGYKLRDSWEVRWAGKMERCVHLALMDLGFRRLIFRCSGCGKRHRELFWSPYNDSRTMEIIGEVIKGLEEEMGGN